MEEGDSKVREGERMALSIPVEVFVTGNGLYGSNASARVVVTRGITDT